MLFNSLQFLIFFLIVTLLYFQLKNQRARVVLLLLSSCYFYMSFVPKYILILGLTIVIDYFAGFQIAKNQGHKRKVWLILSIVANVGILVFYKYFNFLLDNIAPLVHYLKPHYELPYMRVLLPIGLSFHTFQAMSYTIEVYRGKQQPEKSFIVYSLYVMFYPQLVAGPIERPQNLLHQFHEYKSYNWDNIKEGLSRMAWGFFKKVVIADRLAMEVDYAFGHSGLSAWALFIGAVFYSFQIYCDFSGYTDIALGAAKVMGFNLMENFKEPYKSLSVMEFWTRWHISLSTWFRDYVYIPLGGNRRGELRRKFNVFIVFLLSGLWHGANWTFIVWGGIHGTLVTFLPGKKNPQRETNNVKKAILILLNFLVVTLCWIFFRSRNIKQAVNYIYDILSFNKGAQGFGLNVAEMIIATVLIIIMLVRENIASRHFIKSDKLFFLYMVVIVTACYFLGVFTENQFIYFQF